MPLKDLDTVEYFQPLDELANVLSLKTQNPNPEFFRIMGTYYFAKLASMMRCNIQTIDRGVIPVNVYALNLAPSGLGKGFSTNLVEDQVIKPFKNKFMDEIFPVVSKNNLDSLAAHRAITSEFDEEYERTKAQGEFDGAGAIAFSFDSGTTPAIKQLRHKLLMANAGSINLEIDEIGSNMLGQIEILTTCLELYDIGKVKQKLIKNTKEQQRSTEIDGRTPTNMMAYGTPVKLLDGGKTEEELDSMFNTGYARRFIYGYTKSTDYVSTLSPEEILAMYQNPNTDSYLTDLGEYLEDLAASEYFNMTLHMGSEVSLVCIEYRLFCEERARVYTEYQESLKAEMNHRFFKTTKIAGAYAFIDKSAEITVDHFYSAIKLVEDSGKAFQSILLREKNYVRLARYIAMMNHDLTHADIQEDLPFYKGAEAARRDMLNLAIAWGYKNNIVIKKTFDGSIEFFKGESLKELDKENLIVSYSEDVATGYIAESLNIEQLMDLINADGYHWINHHLLVPRRNEENCKKGFNLVVIDVDEGISVETAMSLLKDYEYILHTTKRHTAENNRFRIIFPISHQLEMDAGDFKAFMQNIYSWLPFEVDTETGQRARKWLSHSGTQHYNEGELLDALLFIPETKKSEERQSIIDNETSLNNVERWFMHHTSSGNRSNNLIKYGFMLVDSGMDIQDIQDKILALNSKLPEKLSDGEIFATIMQSLTRKFHERTSDG